AEERDLGIPAALLGGEAGARERGRGLEAREGGVRVAGGRLQLRKRRQLGRDEERRRRDESVRVLGREREDVRERLAGEREVVPGRLQFPLRLGPCDLGVK